MELGDGKAKVYRDGQLMFKGCGYVGLTMFIKMSNNNPAVIARFKPQLEMREQINYGKEASRQAQENSN